MPFFIRSSLLDHRITKKKKKNFYSSAFVTADEHNVRFAPENRVRAQRLSISIKMECVWWLSRGKARELER